MRTRNFRVRNEVVERKCVTKTQKGKKAHVERKAGKCFQWKAHRQFPKRDSCSFSHDKIAFGNSGSGQRRKGRFSSPAPHSKAKTYGEKGNREETSDKRSQIVCATMCGCHEHPIFRSMASWVCFSWAVVDDTSWHVNSEDDDRLQMYIFRQLNGCLSKNIQAESRKQEDSFTRQTSAVTFHNSSLDFHETPQSSYKLKNYRHVSVFYLRSSQMNSNMIWHSRYVWYIISKLWSIFMSKT